MNTINVEGIEKFSLVDFPGKIAAAVFMQGCPWRCPFCYNSAMQEIGRQNDFVWEKFLGFLQKRQGILDAVVFSGGEPLVQDGLGQAMDDVKALGYQIGLHTGGYRPEHLAKILPRVCWVGLDIKAPFEAERYQKAVGGANHLENVQKSLDLLLQSGIDFECRTTCDPRILEIADIYQIGKTLKQKGVKNYHLQKYRPVPSDTVTQETDCEKFFADNELIEFLKESFEVFDIRK